jgi:hypothetical protein
MYMIKIREFNTYTTSRNVRYRQCHKNSLVTYFPSLLHSPLVSSTSRMKYKPENFHKISSERYWSNSPILDVLQTTKLSLLVLCRNAYSQSLLAGICMELCNIMSYYKQQKFNLFIRYLLNVTHFLREKYLGNINAV